MEALRDLNQMAQSASNRFNTYDGHDFVLPQLFKDLVKEINSNSIIYNQYSAVIETKGYQNGTLNIFMPNQWFYVASYFTEFYNELIRYKKYALKVATKEQLKLLNGATLGPKESQAIQTLDLTPESKEYLIKFITDYSWWGGAKTIDRGDFYVSPVLSHAKLVNASQSFVAELCAFLADKPELVNSIINEEGNSTILQQTINRESPLQQIFYGAPGTGKSHKVKEVTDKLPKSDVFRTTFHPDSDYSTFVGCYKPKMVKAPIRDSSGHEITSACEEEKKRIAYEYEPQAFLKAYVRAYETNEPVFLVIEEINRGNCAQIFGDMFQLLDRNDNGESDYAIKPETAVQDFLREKLKDCDIADDAVKSGEEMRLPGNLFIWGTMNTSDQSLFPIDSAFKRRWDWKYVPIDYDKEAWSIVAKGEQYSWSDFLKKMNSLVAGATDSEDKMLGFYFAKAKNGIIDADTFVGKVVFYLWNDVFKDYGLPKEILNGVESKEFAFRNFFMADGRANEDMVKRLLDNLGVAKPAGTDFPVEDTEHQDEA